MRYGIRTLRGFTALLVLACVPSAVIASSQSFVAEFVGSTPGGTLAREFVAGLASNAPCHCVTWRMRLFGDRNTGGTYKLIARYQVPARNNPNQSEDGPTVESQGRWEFVGDAESKGATIYRMTAAQSQRSVSFAKVGEDLLHLLNPDGTLMVGNGGWSYTLNRADRAEKQVDTALAMAAPDMSYKISPLASGPDVFGVFEGRSPCQGIARELRIVSHEGCPKVKWRVTLYRNAETSAPTTYKVEGSLHRPAAREGTWSIERGAKVDPNATVYRLNGTPGEGALLLLRADENVLFFLNRQHEPLVGHAEFSYTLNRVIRE